MQDVETKAKKDCLLRNEAMTDQMVVKLSPLAFPIRY
jgi:hypothetical protein